MALFHCFPDRWSATLLQIHSPLISCARASLFPCSDGAPRLIGGKWEGHAELSSSPQVAGRCDLVVSGIVLLAWRPVSCFDSWSQLTSAGYPGGSKAGGAEELPRCCELAVL